MKILTLEKIHSLHIVIMKVVTDLQNSVVQQFFITVIYQLFYLQPKELPHPILSIIKNSIQQISDSHYITILPNRPTVEIT